VKHPLLTSILVAALPACGSSPAKPTHITSPTADGHPAGGAVAATDPALAARQAFANPGGMWMPRQMTLPIHDQNLRRMGVAIAAKDLADPLAEPLAAVVWLGDFNG
jgi:hypothetical protein